MRRIAAVVALACTVSVVAAAPEVGAQGADTSLNRLVTGEFTGTSAFEFTVEGCSFVFETYDLTYPSIGGRPGTVHIEGCVNLAGVTGGFAFESGQAGFTLTTATGATLTGTVTGGVFPIDLTLTVTGGTRQLQRVTGTIAVAGTGGPSGPVSGTITGGLSRG